LIRPSELARWARDANLVIEEFAGLEYNPITRSARLTRDVSLNYLAHLRRADSAK
jgi:2-polyprenyl-6-hydroxyphenyl methylase/3-demethylubiquinone-9 3-methyltransferase